VKKRICVFCSLLILGFQLFGTGLLAYPRKINLLKTQHFDILYADQSSTLAAYIAENAEKYFIQAQYELETENSFRMPVVISPDSDKLSVSYSFYPYNRLIVFDGVPALEQLGYEDSLGSMLYREIFLAVAQSKMSPLNQFIHDRIAGDKYLPVSLFNLPANFVDGYGYLVQSEYDYSQLNDGYYLQLLAEAKLEGEFPTWFQMFAKRDTYPGDVLSLAAGTAFTAYLIQSRGIDKYIEFWEECGYVHPFFAAGIIRKVYGTKIPDLWKEFEQSIPLPENLETLKALEEDVVKLFENYESIYESLVYSDSGIIWYDELRHEVAYYDSTQKELLPIIEKQKKLFAAEGVEKLSVSPDGQYLLISFTQTKKDGKLHKNLSWIYNLKTKTFLEDTYKLRDAAFVKLENGQVCVAGVNVEDKNAKLQIYSSINFGAESNELIFEKSFPRNVIPFSPVYAGNGKIMYLEMENKDSAVCLVDVITKEESKFYITDLEGRQLRIKNLTYQNVGDQSNEQELYAFQYSVASENPLVRTGSFVLDQNMVAAVSLQGVDVSGGVHNPVFNDDKIIFASRRLYHDELEILPSQKLEFQPGAVVVAEEKPVQNQYKLFEEYEDFDFSEYDISKYSLLTYWHRFSAIPFIPIKNISFEDGADSSIGLGAIVKLVPDPFANNKLTISGAWSFLNLDFVWMMNAPKDEEKIINQTSQVISKDKTFAFFYENTSTPVTIEAGSLYRFNLQGGYDFEALSGVSWTVPLGFTFNEMEFDVYGNYKASTDYYDANLSEVYESKTGFPTFENAYETASVTANIRFKNIHQFGSSSFEQKGFSAGVKVYSIWDIYKYRIRQESEPYVSQLFLGVNGSVAVPKIIPLKPNKEGWILGLPTVASIEVADKAGEVLKTNVEMLLVGKEVQNGFPYVNFYCNRLGLKAGYDFALKYDTGNIKLPDFRRFDYMYDIFSHSNGSHSLYVLFNLDFLFPIGPLSQRVISSAFKTTYYPGTNGYTFNLDFTVRF